MGGVYRDQGVKVVRKWLIPVIQPHVEAAYRNVRNDFLLLPEPETVPRSRVSTTPYPSPSPPSFATSEGAEPVLPSHPASVPSDLHQSLPPRVNAPQQGSVRVGGGIENYPKDLSSRIRRRRRSSQGNCSDGDIGKQRIVSQRRHC